MDIDWNKGPEGAIGHAFPTNEGEREIWYRRDASGGLEYCIASDTDVWLESCSVPEQVVWRKEQVVSGWSGEGDPPVGTVCELTESVLLADATDAEWFEEGTQVEVGGHAFFNGAEGSVCTICVVGGNHTGTLTSLCLRPTRTPEQIEQEERRKAIGEMLDIFKSNYEGHPSDGLQALYDAGYRMQVAP